MRLICVGEGGRRGYGIGSRATTPLSREFAAVHLLLLLLVAQTLFLFFFHRSETVFGEFQHVFDLFLLGASLVLCLHFWTRGFPHPRDCLGDFRLCWSRLTWSWWRHSLAHFCTKDNPGIWWTRRFDLCRRCWTGTRASRARHDDGRKRERE